MKKPIVIVGISVGALLGGAMVVVVLAGLWYETSETLPVSGTDWKLVVTAGDLTPYFDDYSPSEKHDSIEKIKYFDDSEELTYEYDSPVDDEPYIVVTISKERRESDANSTYAIEWSAQRVGLNIADGTIDLDEDNTFYSAGDQSRFANITKDGNTFGHIMVVRKGKSVYAFTIMGFVLDDPTIWNELFDNRIASL